MLKTPNKFMAKIQIQRSNNQGIIERTINLSDVVQQAIVNHLVDNNIASDSVTALSMIDRWRVKTIWLDEPV